MTEVSEIALSVHHLLKREGRVNSLESLVYNQNFYGGGGRVD